jgi:hypothetical protein
MRGKGKGRGGGGIYRVITEEEERMVSKVIRMSVTGFTRLPGSHSSRGCGGILQGFLSLEIEDAGRYWMLYLQSCFTGPFNRIRFVNKQF